MSAEDVWQAYWRSLFGDIDDENGWPNVKPLLAHYTSLATIEKIVAKGEIWLANPLYMNDVEEVRFLIHAGIDAAAQSDVLRSGLGTNGRFDSFVASVFDAYEEYGRSMVGDLYVICFSRHKPKEMTDGRLSMWRGYGDNGAGAAIVFDTKNIPFDDGTPFVLAPVEYGTSDERKAKVENKLTELGDFFSKNHLIDDHLLAAGRALFQRLCLSAVFSKHIGFGEEEEWRLVYFPERDEDGDYRKYFGYFNGSTGIEPKLKLELDAFPQMVAAGIGFNDLVDTLIIGPSASAPLTEMSVKRMLTQIGREELTGRVKLSTIPYRAKRTH